jgi:hypothetical protein
MKRLVLLLGVLFVAQMLVVGAVSASYKSQNDIILNVNAPVNAPSLNTGSTTFNIQEAVHGTVYGVSGTSIDHSYIWIQLNGQSLLAIDPPKFMF